MELFFSPLACSMATRISLYEAGATADFVLVDGKTKRTATGEDFWQINPVGLVPTLRDDDGTVLAENAAVLQYVADKFPEAHLAPDDALGRARLRQWLNFIGTEIHKALFVPLLDEKAPEGAKTYAIDKGTARLDHLERVLKDREFLLDAFSVADAYLVTVLGWSVATPIKLERWPVLAAYVARLHQRPSVARALGEEFPMYQSSLKQKKN
jgi:glutathione S-transferase